MTAEPLERPDGALPSAVLDKDLVSAVCRERLDTVFDDWDLMLAVDGVAVGMGVIHGVETVAFATDPAIQGGALGIEGCGAISDATDIANLRQAPCIGIWHSGGARLREGVGSLDAVGRIFAAQTRASGRVPQISVVLGPAAGGAAYGPALTDVVIMGPAGRVFVTGPDVVRRVTGEQIDMERLGGPQTHGTVSGVAHLVAPTDEEALYSARRLALLLGKQRGTCDEGSAVNPGDLVPDDPRHSYDVRPVVRAILDPGSYLELHRDWATSAVTMLGRLGGRTVGVVANDPQRLAGCLDAATGDKTGRFVTWCDTMGLPLVFVVDVPGYLPGVGQEDEGVLRRGAKLLHAYAGARVPRLTVITRKAYGGAFIAMGSKGLGADAVFAWPGAQVDVMGATAAVEVLNKRELAAEKDPSARAALVTRLAAEHEATTGGLTRALECGAVDEIIEPAQTRAKLLEALASLPQRRGKRPNGPQ
ncbi:MAG: acetyl-CoA/propionyl-CoA carboxylase carboxyl transferase subunit [Frankiales bacterium]|jgi:acetyl-CoA/propionyl-CoA carboxylase carboxyl transferase subunit|nr:acetyl-CoA/propionyl-CoA carboxylase carboxyl transferase subunit [Frankiales bacterium]